MSTRNLETQLRTYFAADHFRPQPGWEERAMRAAKLAAPAPSHRVAWAIARHRGHLLSVAAAVVVAMILAITALPTAAGIGTPEWVLGLRTAVHIDSSSNGRATSWGTTLEVVGAYLDDQRTIVVLKANDANLVLSNAYLGVRKQRHRMQQVVSGQDGYYAVRFEPLPEASSSPLAVTLRLASFPTRVWTLDFTILRGVGQSTIPLPGRVGNMAITFTSVKGVPGALVIRFTETGLTYDQILGSVHVSNSGGVQATVGGPLNIRIQVFSSTGESLEWLDTQLIPASDGSASVSFSAVYLRSAPGPYKIVIVGPLGDSLERTVEFPA